MRDKVNSEERAKKWSELIRAQAESGLSIGAFCTSRQINRSTFCFWKQKLRSLEREKNSSSRFISVTTGSLSPRDTSLPKAPRLFLPGGVQIDLGEGLQSESVRLFILNLCGVFHAQS